MVLLTYLNNFGGALEMSLIIFEIIIEISWSKNRVIVATDMQLIAGATFLINDTKLYVPVVNLSIQDNIKLLEQLKSGFKRTINWNKY